jgi:ABC-type sugar transport system substrate-binding protein
MTTRRALLQGTAALGAALMARPAFAQSASFPAFDFAHIGPNPPSADLLKQMVAAAMAKTKPNNGSRYLFGYTMWGGSSPFSQLNRQGIQALCDAAGIDLIVADNVWDPQRNVANAQTFALRHVDFVINSLLDIHFAAAVKHPLDQAGIPIISLDIPIPGTEWVGVNNAAAGFRSGTYLAQSAVAKWGLPAAMQANVVVASFRAVGPNGILRNMSEEAGIRAVLKGIPDSQVIWLDMTGTEDSGFERMNSLLGRLDPSKPLLLTSFSDEQLAGALRAVSVAGRNDKTLACGMGGERLDVIGSDPSFIGTVSFFPRGYANAAIPAALGILAGVPVPKSVFAYSELVKPDTVCQIDPKVPCRPRPGWQAEDASVDAAAYKAFVASLYGNPEFSGFHMLLPAVGT